MRDHRRQQAHGQLVDAEKVGGKLLHHLRAADALQWTIDAISGVIKQAKQAVIGQGDDLLRGVIDAFRAVEVEQYSGKPHAVHALHIIGFAAGGQYAKALAFQF